MHRSDVKILWDTAQRLRQNRKQRRRQGLYPLEMAILYVTMRCNAQCDHCFCWQDLNVGLPEMTLPQIERLADTIPPLRELVLTGGEPLLRSDLAEILAAFAARGKAETLTVNTNGLHPQKILALAETFKSRFPAVGLVFQISLDGLEKTHDRIRRVPGNFRKAIESLRGVYSLKPRHPNLAAQVLTVITSLNYTELIPLNEYLRREIDPALLHGFELVRGFHTTVWGVPEEIAESNVAPRAMELPPREAFPAIARDLRRINRLGPYRASTIHVHNLAQLRMVETQREQFKCVTAGQSVAVIYCTGDVAHCEFTKPFANLDEFDYDFHALWHSPAADQRRAQIHACYCTHGCFHGKAVEYSWKGIAETAYRALTGL